MQSFRSYIRQLPKVGPMQKLINFLPRGTAGVLKLVDKLDLGSSASCVWVRLPSPAQKFSKKFPLSHPFRTAVSCPPSVCSRKSRSRSPRLLNSQYEDWQRTRAADQSRFYHFFASDRQEVWYLHHTCAILKPALLFCFSINSLCKASLF